MKKTDTSAADSEERQRKELTALSSRGLSTMQAEKNTKSRRRRPINRWNAVGEIREAKGVESHDRNNVGEGTGVDKLSYNAVGQ